MDSGQQLMISTEPYDSGPGWAGDRRRRHLQQPLADLPEEIKLAAA